MKKLIIIFMISFMILVHETTINVDASSDLSKRIMSKHETDAFDYIYAKFSSAEKGDIFVENRSTDDDLILVGSNEIEMKAIFYDMVVREPEKYTEKAEKIKEKEDESDQKALEKYIKSISKKDKEGLRQSIKEDKILDKHPELLEILLSGEEMIDTRYANLYGTYYFETQYTGLYEDYDDEYTYLARYQYKVEYYYLYLGEFKLENMPSNTYRYIYQQTGMYDEGEFLEDTTDFRYTHSNSFTSADGKYYYKIVRGNILTQNDNYHKKYLRHETYDKWEKVYTGGSKYVLVDAGQYEAYKHEKVYNFDYRSFQYVSDSLNAPLATIDVILDYQGDQKMIISSTDANSDYKITQYAHYNRNQYNGDLDQSYPTLDSLSSSFGSAEDDIASYFHRLLPSNDLNLKYLLDVRYYDSQIGEYVYGQKEIVYAKDSENQDPEDILVEYDPLVTFSFNFGVHLSEESGTPTINDAHWLRDVYPYLIWGNNSDDYSNHTAFERFVWDKDSGNGWSQGSLEGNNLEGQDLTGLYVDAPFCVWPCNGIGNAYATSIPSVAQNGNIDFEHIVQNSDNVAPTFDYIGNPVKIIVNQHTNINWTYLINNEYDNGGSTIKFELEDNVLYGTIGNYTVVVCLEDAAGNRKIQTITVMVSSC